MRYHFVPPSIFPATLGAILSLVIDHTLYPWYFLLVLIGVIVNHVALNMADDYFDYKHAVDRLKPGEKNPFTGGSRTLSTGQIGPSSMLKAFTGLFAVTVLIGLYLTGQRGLPVLVFGLIGVSCSIFYTAPPVSFSHHGLGELGMLLNFGPTIGLGSYFVQAQRLNTEAFLATLPMGMMLFSMIVINEIPDYEEDREEGKYTLIARYGKRAGVKIYTASWVLTYSVLVAAVLLRITHTITLVSFLSVRYAYRSIRTLRNSYESPTELAPANLDMIKAHSVTCLALIGAYSLQGLANGADPLQLTLILLLLAISYAPAATTLIKNDVA